jgi:hypothetical protein
MGSPGRSFDVDDLILNTAGAALAHPLVPIGRAVRRAWERRLPSRPGRERVLDFTGPPDSVLPAVGCR